MRLASIVIMTAVSALTAGSAAAEEKPVRLRQAPGLDKVEAHCSACHSLDYVQMNSPFLSAAGWDAEVAKMINAFGARIDAADVKTIADYLNQNYGIESSSLEKDKGVPEPPSSNLKSASPRVAVRTSNRAPAKRRSVHRDFWACSGLNRVIFGSSCSRRSAFAWSARHWPLVLN
jgi:sulfite dehydrogenase (cytochrome) subunit B